MQLIDIIGDRRKKADRRGMRHHPLARELAEALELRRVDMLFQPQFCSRTGAMTGAEALVRWAHPQFGEIAGDSLFEIAGMSGLAEKLSAFVFEEALHEAASWPEHLRLSLNVTPADLAGPDFVPRLMQAKADAGVAPSRVTLEITEQSLFDQLDKASVLLEQLVSRGVKVALDDFGAGFCNFRYLKVLPLHYLKLDRIMVDGITRDGRDLEVLRGIIAMAHALDLDVIAEGIETEQQREAVVREGCAGWQGYLGAKPMRASDFAGLLGR